MPHVEQIPEELCNELLTYFYNTYNPYATHKSRWGDNVNGYVAFYPIDPKINNKLIEFFKSKNKFNNIEFYYQVLTGTNRVAPHVDPKEQRSKGYLFLLDQGGDNVLTRWYKLKDKVDNDKILEGAPIPDQKLKMIEEHHLKLRSWYFGDYSIIHSVENLERPRITIIPYKASIEY